MYSDWIQNRPRLISALLLAVVAVCWCVNLDYPLVDRTETRVGEISREMLVNDQWASLSLNFKPYYDKPPLTYWLCAASLKLFGQSAWPARLISVLASLATLGTTMYFAHRWFGHRVGVLAALVLATTSGFVLMSRFLVSDTVLAACVALATFLGIEALRPHHSAPKARWLCLASGIVCGLGFLAKGPVAIVLAGVPMIAQAVMVRPSLRHALICLVAGNLGVLLVVGPWLAWTLAVCPEYPITFLIDHNLHRFAGKFHERPFWYFLPVVLLAGHPWSFLTFPVIVDLSRKAYRHPWIQRTELIALMLGAAWCFVFFSCSRGKLPTYLLPMASPMSVVVAVYLVRILQCRDSSLADQRWHHRLAQRHAPWMAMVATCCVGCTLLVCQRVVLNRVSENMLFILLACWVCLLVLLMWGWRRDWFSGRAWSASIAMMFATSLIALHWHVPSFAVYQSMVPAPASRHHALLPELQNQEVIVTIGQQYPGVPFQLGRNDIRNFQTWDEFEGYCQEQSELPDAMILFAHSEFKPEESKLLADSGLEVAELAKLRRCRILKIRSSAANRQAGRPPQTSTQATILDR